MNFNPHEATEVAYQVYHVAVTPGWGESYKDSQLQPWLHELYRLLVSGKISESEIARAEAKWMEQFS